MFVNVRARDYADFDENFAANIKRFREDRGWSQGTFADKLNQHGLESYHQTTVSRVEKLERPVRIGEAWHICAVLGVTIDRMLSDPQRSDYLDALRVLVRDMDAAYDAIEKAVDEYLNAQTRVKAQVAGYGVERPDSMDEYTLRVEGSLLASMGGLLELSLSDAIEEAKDTFYEDRHGVDQEEG